MSTLKIGDKFQSPSGYTVTLIAFEGKYLRMQHTNGVQYAVRQDLVELDLKGQAKAPRYTADRKQGGAQ